MRSDVTRVIRRIAERRGVLTPYSPEVAHSVVTRLAEGATLTAICSMRGMPSPLTVRRWREANPEFERAFQLAFEVGNDAKADECIEISDDSDGDYIERVADKETGETEFVLRPSNVARAKLRISTRLDILERRDARYSKRQNVTHSGSLSLAALIDESYQAPAIEGQARVIEDNE